MMRVGLIGKENCWKEVTDVSVPYVWAMHNSHKNLDLLILTGFVVLL